LLPTGDHPERSRYDEVLLTSRLEKALTRINPGMITTVLQTRPEKSRKPPAIERVVARGIRWRDALSPHLRINFS